MAEGGISGLFSRFTGANRSGAQAALDGTNIDKKTIERVQRLLEKLVKYCSNPDLGLKRSPPYLLDLLPHMFQTLAEIFKQYDTRMNELNSNSYFRLFIENVCNKLKRGIKLFRDNRNVFNENSTERKTLTRLSLHISHMLLELKALFPNSIFIGCEFRITKEEASDFWKNYFGDKVIVTWKEFRMTLSGVHPITSSYEAMALKSTIDLTHNDMVSVFEYDVFTRLFQPWDTLLINWKMLAVTHTGYQAFLTYGEVKERLHKYIHKPGTYIFRLSCTRLGLWAIGYVTNEHEILQTIPQNKSLCEALILGAQDGYYLYPDGKDQNPDLTVIQHEKQKKVIQVTEEEYEIYTSMGSTFQQCKICQENDKDVKLQPCSHLLCSECLFSWQEHDKSTALTCPFCRAQVKDYEQVEVDPFQGSVTTLQKARSKGSAATGGVFRTVTEQFDGAGPSSRAALPQPGAPPIPDRGDRKTVKGQANSPHTNNRNQPPLPRRPTDGGDTVPTRRPAEDIVPSRWPTEDSTRRPSEDTVIPSRPPPLPPVNTMPINLSMSGAPPILTAPPTASDILQSPSSGLPPGTSPALPLTQPPPLHSTPGNDTLSSSMSATNPFFSDVQALQDTHDVVDSDRRATNYANVEYYGGAREDTTTDSTRRTTIFSKVSQELYCNTEDDVLLTNGTRSFLSQSSVQDVNSNVWEAGQFEDHSPPPADIYCNVDQADVTNQNMMPSEDITKLGTASPGLGRSSSSGLMNIALRPTSMYDPDQSLFDAAHLDENDIYENQSNLESVYDNEGPLSGSVSTPPKGAPPDIPLHDTTHSTARKLREEGFADADIVRAMEIVGDNENMTRKILQSFVSRN